MFNKLFFYIYKNKYNNKLFSNFYYLFYIKKIHDNLYKKILFLKYILKLKFNIKKKYLLDNFLYLKKILNTYQKNIYILKNNIKQIIAYLPNKYNKINPIGKKNYILYNWGKLYNYNYYYKNYNKIINLNNKIIINKYNKINNNFIIMKDNVVLLYRALIQFMLEIHIFKHSYKEYYLPILVNSKSLYGTGHLPFFKKNLFYINNKKLYLIPTGEVPLTNLMSNTLISFKNLPIKMVTCTSCFRIEKIGYGKRNKFIRLHQFEKIELVQIVSPKYSMITLEEITQNAEKILTLLMLPYRKILLCNDELSYISNITYDLEVWLPISKIYLEVSSCSNLINFQTKKLNIYYYHKKLIKKELHTINGSGLAIWRTLLGIIENYQILPGLIKIPNILKKYMNNIKYINFN